MQRRRRCLPRLAAPPVTLGEALTVFESSDFVKAAFGVATASHYAAHAKAEWNAMLAAITDWELPRGFEAV